MRNWIKKIIFFIWIIIALAIAGLFIAAIRKKNQSICKGIIIEIEKNQNQSFLSEKEIEQLLTTNNTSIIGKPLLNINIRALENVLLANIWIQKANLFFDNNNILHIHTTQRKPIARVFTANGQSFYINADTILLPIVPHISLQLPVFTNFSSLRGIREAVKLISNYILADSFWMAQIQQINITPEQTFEIIPTIGNQLILFGDTTNYKNKFNRLKIFYQKAWLKTGLEKYAILDLRFNKQIVATRKGAGTTHIDTLQTQQWMQKFIQQHPQQIDSLSFISPPLGDLEGAIDTATIANTIDQTPIDTIIKSDTNTHIKNKLTFNKQTKNNKQKLPTNKSVIKKPKVHL